MATFLRTAKMNPALAARVERAVHGGRAASGAITRRITAIARVVFVLTLAFALYSFASSRRQAQRDLDRARVELLDRVKTESAALDAEDKNIVTSTETWLARLAAAEYEGDVIDETLRHPGELHATLERSILWVRGPIAGFAGSAKIKETALGSAKESFLLCLLDPPSSKAEKVLLDPVRVAYLGGAPVETRTPNVRRLDDAIAGLPFYMPAWSERVRNAADRAEIEKLRGELDKASFERTKKAVKSRLLLVAMDEPGTGGGPTELDGERPHFVRVALVDLSSSKVLLRLRRHVDPSFISQAKRPTYANGLDSCALAYDVHDELKKR
jgi:hypothetical protein